MAFHPLFTHPDVALSNGNRTLTMGGSANAVKGGRTVLAATTPRYAEIKGSAWGVAPFCAVGVSSANYMTQTGSWVDSWAYYQQNGYKYIGDTSQGAFGDAFTTDNDVVGVAYDPTTGSVWFSKNGVWQGGGDPANGLNPAFTGVPSGLYLFATLYRRDSPVHVLTGSFLTEHFQYPAPAGFAPWDQVYSIAGNATKVGGGPVDQVVIRQWETRALVAIVTPDAVGDWTAEVPPSDYDITYFATACQPICHGPYTVTAS